MKTIGIVGLGVMGGSFAARLRELGYHVLGFDPNGQTLEYALDHHMIDEAYPQANEHLSECDMIILCLYPTLLKEWILSSQKYLRPDTLILEISGVKESIMDSLQECVRDDVELLSIHPMCGRESKGIRHADPAIFKNANFIIVPHQKNSFQALVTASSLAKDLGCKNISVLEADAHDAMIAFLSQLTHVIAVALMNTHENAHLVEYTGDSFRDLTRIAKINESMWSELFILNKDRLLQEIDQFSSSLQNMRKAIEEEDAQTMQQLFIESTKRREKFD